MRSSVPKGCSRGFVTRALPASHRTVCTEGPLGRDASDTEKRFASLQIAADKDALGGKFRQFVTHIFVKQERAFVLALRHEPLVDVEKH